MVVRLVVHFFWLKPMGACWLQVIHGILHGQCHLFTLLAAWHSLQMMVIQMPLLSGDVRESKRAVPQWRHLMGKGCWPASSCCFFAKRWMAFSAGCGRLSEMSIISHGAFCLCRKARI